MRRNENQYFVCCKLAEVSGRWLSLINVIRDDFVWEMVVEVEGIYAAGPGITLKTRYLGDQT